MDKTATAERIVPRPAGGFFFRHVYVTAALGAVVFHLLFFLAFSASLTTSHPPAPVTKNIEVNLAPVSTDPGPQPVGMEDAADYAPEPLAGEHEQLPDNVFETPVVETPDTQVAASVPEVPAFESSQVDTSHFDFNMPSVAQKPVKPRSAGNKGGQPGKASKGASDGRKGGSPGNSGGSGGGDVNVPRYKYTPLPPYPDKARKESHEGTVLIAIDVDSSGNPVSVIVRKSSGFPELDEATVKHVRTAWKFHPAVIDGQPASSTVVVPVVFNLKNA